MLKKNWLFSLAFAIIFVAQLIVEWNGLTVVNYITKPLVTISLMVFYVSHTQLKGKFAKKIFFGLLFGLAGDCFLMLLNQNASFFIFGLLSFLIGHLFYVSAFYLDFKSNPVIQKMVSRIALVVFGIFCTSFYLYLRPYLGNLKIPVLVYAFVISLMAIMAVNRRGRVNTLSFNLIFCGALAFLVSDSLLAVNKFVGAFNFSGIAIMATYMLAQYLITMGAVQRKFKPIS
jgi:uncharacterized membrane protein YhhN